MYVCNVEGKVGVQGADEKVTPVCLRSVVSDRCILVERSSRLGCGSLCLVFVRLFW